MVISLPPQGEVHFALCPLTGVHSRYYGYGGYPYFGNNYGYSNPYFGTNYGYSNPYYGYGYGYGYGSFYTGGPVAPQNIAQLTGYCNLGYGQKCGGAYSPR